MPSVYIPATAHCFELNFGENVDSATCHTIFTGYLSGEMVWLKSVC